ncbi:TetR/AcrR family transcriptional regulator [Ammoniphilus sp. CFH 90114]|uniref:TetR/AcrR family transcriptional regulator n=1 Tax=Ammoniphilus sp. CFH 90114 TaxID=2493665 RepID=UPI00100E3E78|nr:TetR/AcrR family transcriptional regulator [Ammoniphilus sp. CFH 90114]RXT06389.1 TetR/AcrR family transcriptional regulator [Ammoniphilus sp. CFH 90114]
MSPRKAVDKELTREMIMNVARMLFVKQGYQHVSMRKIAAELGYSHGAIYYHFKNKAELFYALVEEDFSLLNHELEEVMSLSAPSIEKIRQILLRFIRFGLTHQNHYEIMFLLKDEEVRGYTNEGPNRSYDNFASSLYLLSEQKLKIKEIWSIFLMLHGFVAHYCRSDQDYDEVKDLAESHVDFIMRAIR